MKINLNNKKFKSEFNSDNGEVSDETIFTYYQENNIIWADYSGGQVIKGNLVGNIFENQLEFVYHHINLENKLMTGRCISHPENTKEGKIRLREKWQWTCGDNSSGESTLIEI